MQTARPIVETGAYSEAITPGDPLRLGATVVPGGVNFVVHAPAADAVELCLWDATGAGRASVRLPARTGDRWHGFLPAEWVRPGDHYAYRVHGAWDPATGLRHNPHKLLLDPAARRLSGTPRHDPSLHDGPWTNALDSAAVMPRGCIVDSHFDWGETRRPARPWDETVIYELHVRGFTMRHPDVPPALRGTYLGLAEPCVIDWLQRLGVTAVELMPCQAFMSEAFLERRGLTNYWGYNPIVWSAPASQYAIDDPVTEFQQMVRALHGAGIEVILDVVFNHTAEGNEQGPVLSLKGFDNAGYYLLDPNDAQRYENFTGCGNTIDAGSTPARALILDSLRYWVETMQVDGFRFDLATVLGRERRHYHRENLLFAAMQADPILSTVKWIAEPWDMGPDGYQLGHFPRGWAEWNDRFRDQVRSFWRGDRGGLGGFAERLCGSADLFRHRARAPFASLNFVTAHDGFTLADLVSYAAKQNEANLEDNRDGHDHNLSFNCGVEGPTDDAGVQAQRRTLRLSLLASVLLAQGTPMLLAGDECGRTQQGNNNAYCQDQPLAWFDWSMADAERLSLDFVRRLTALRAARPELRRERFFDLHTAAVTWWHPHGRVMDAGDWRDDAHALGQWLSTAGSGRSDLLLLWNAWVADVSFVLPSGQWQLLLSSAAPADAATPIDGGCVTVAGRSMCVLEGLTARGSDGDEHSPLRR